MGGQLVSERWSAGREEGMRERGRKLAVWELVRGGWGQEHPLGHAQRFDFSVSVQLTRLWQEDNALEGLARGEAIKCLFYFL